MSRGFGKWQRAILAALAEREAFYLVDILPHRHSKSQYNAVSRAAIHLRDAGMIDMHYWAYSHPNVVVSRLGMARPDRPALDRARCPAPSKCWTSTPVAPIQHLAEQDIILAQRENEMLERHLREMREIYKDPS
jgi:hypothetical protein